MRVARWFVVLIIWAVAGCGASATDGAGSATASGGDAGDSGSLADGAVAGDDAMQPGADVGADAAADSATDLTTADVAADPPCPSGKQWTKGNQGSAFMQPGLACINCHKKSGGEAPSFAVAGTVYPSKHAVDKCYGSGAIKVEIIGSDGYVTTLTTNSAGNFYQSKFSSKIVLPYTAKVYNAAGDYLEMTTPQNNGDCNACHTVDGVDGPSGRIVAP